MINVNNRLGEELYHGLDSHVAIIAGANHAGFLTDAPKWFSKGDLSSG